MALIANTHPASDGVWFWYSYYLDHGKRLYADMHMPLQPLFVLETSAFMAVLGKGWLVSKIPAVLHVVAYCLALLLLVRQSTVSDARRAIVLTCSFFITISSVAYDFNDYRSLTDCFMVCSLLTLLALRTSSSGRRTLGLVTILGALSGLALTTRPNDGGALLVGILLAIACLAPARKLISLLLFTAATAITVLIVVRLTGDSFHDYLTYAIFNSAGRKGGGSSVLVQPLVLAWGRIESTFLVWPRPSIPVVTLWRFFLLAQSWLFLVYLFRHRGGRRWFGVVTLTIVVTAIEIQQFYLFFKGLGTYRFIQLFENAYTPLVFLLFGLGTWAAARFILSLFDSERAAVWDRREILLLIPLGQLASGSMSSSGTHFDHFESLGIVIILLTICSPLQVTSDWARRTLFTMATLLTLCAIAYRIYEPYSWHTYVEKPMFVNRTWYKHPDYEQMIIDRDLLNMIKPVYQNIRNGGSDDELLALPLPYANYFGSIPPWHGYVQTFFDISEPETIQNLMDELSHSPPKWIFLQNEPGILQMSEVEFNHGNPLQQRYLNQLIQQNITDGKWRVVYTSDFENGPRWDNHWMLIQTR